MSLDTLKISEGKEGARRGVAGFEVVVLLELFNLLAKFPNPRQAHAGNLLLKNTQHNQHNHGNTQQPWQHNQPEAIETIGTKQS